MAAYYPSPQGSILITGTSSGIGHAAVQLLAHRGFPVFAGVRKTADADRVQALAPAGCITPVQLDITDAGSVSAAVARVRQALTERRSFLTGVISNAGVGMIAPATYLNEDILHYQTETNLLGHMRLARECIPLMQETLAGQARRGRFYFVGTGAGIPSLVFPLLGSYMACKWGVEAFCQSLRLEMSLTGSPIDVGMINPGFINTAMRGSTRQAVQGKVSMDAAFGATYGELMQQFARFGDRQQGTSPEAVAEAIWQALQRVTPRYRYRVGRDSWTTALEARLPLPVQEWLIRKKLLALDKTPASEKPGTGSAQ